MSLNPNPNDGTFVITGLKKNTSFQVFDERGRLVLESVVESDEMEIKMPVVPVSTIMGLLPKVGSRIDLDTKGP